MFYIKTHSWFSLLLQVYLQPNQKMLLLPLLPTRPQVNSIWFRLNNPVGWFWSKNQLWNFWTWNSKAVWWCKHRSLSIFFLRRRCLSRVFSVRGFFRPAVTLNTRSIQPEALDGIFQQVQQNLKHRSKWLEEKSKMGKQSLMWSNIPFLNVFMLL